MEAYQLQLPDIPPGEDELPFSFGPPMDSDLHGHQENVLVLSLRLAWKDREDAYVAGNMAMYFSELQLRKNDFLGPDVFVVLDTVNRPRKSWVVWQEGCTPDVVIELLSPSTEANDRGDKKRIYARQLRVPEYYLYDPVDGRFEGFLLDPGHGVYTPRTPEADGGFASERLGLRLVPMDGVFLGEPCRLLRWQTLEGVVLPLAEELVEGERGRAEAERGRAEAEHARAEGLLALLRSLGHEVG